MLEIGECFESIRNSGQCLFPLLTTHRTSFVAFSLSLSVSPAALSGKEDALFVMSGTLSNQLAIRTHLKQPPYSILCDSR